EGRIEDPEVGDYRLSHQASNGAIPKRSIPAESRPTVLPIDIITVLFADPSQSICQFHILQRSSAATATMSKFGVLVMGPAGAGKTTFCNALIQHLQNTRRSCFYVNLDPAAETFSYEPDLDIRELITL